MSGGGGGGGGGGILTLHDVFRQCTCMNQFLVSPKLCTNFF